MESVSLASHGTSSRSWVVNLCSFLIQSNPQSGERCFFILEAKLCLETFHHTLTLCCHAPFHWKWARCTCCGCHKLPPESQTSVGACDRGRGTQRISPRVKRHSLWSRYLTPEKKSASLFRVYCVLMLLSSVCLRFLITFYHFENESRLIFIYFSIR